MVCVYCGNETRVINSRHQKRANSVWRRRQCMRCHTVFTSIEQADLSASIIVKKDSAIEPFSRDKLLLTIHDSLRHRKTALRDAQSLTDTVISKLSPYIHDATIDSLIITEVSLAVLINFDQVAATHYRAFHPAK